MWVSNLRSSRELGKPGGPPGCRVEDSTQTAQGVNGGRNWGETVNAERRKTSEPLLFSWPPRF